MANRKANDGRPMDRVAFRAQTIVAPPDVKLNHDVPLPNVVSVPQRTVAVPIEATVRSLAAR